MIELIEYTDNLRWNNIVSSYQNKDTYYECEYATSFMEIEDGIPYLLYYRDIDCNLCYPIFEKDISKFEAFEGKLPLKKYYDWNTPYGYGGPLTNHNFNSFQQQKFKEELFQVAYERNVISQFIRFHPLLQNQNVCKEVIENNYIKDTIFINLDTEEDLMVQMDPKNRNLVRKAIKNNVEIRHDNGKMMDEFIRIYEITMDRDNARSFYYFPKSYYNYMKEHMGNETEYFYAFKDGKMIASSIFFYNQNYIHYHLSGNLVDYRTYAPTNLLIYTAANWAREQGIKALHLGGGVGVEDSLFHFKKQFNKEGRISFYIGRNIFNLERYKELVCERQKLNPKFDINNTYYIQYRKPEE